MELLSGFLPTLGLVLAVVDPFGYVPVILSMTADNTEQERERMVRVAVVTAFVVLAGFTVLGQEILRFFRVSVPALQISGGLILLVIGFDMLKVLPIVPRIMQSEQKEGIDKPDISIVPLAIPMLSGPAAIATVIVLGAGDESLRNYGLILGAVAVTLMTAYVVLRFAGQMLELLGKTGLNVITRLMGLLLTAMAVQFVIDGFRAIPSP